MNEILVDHLLDVETDTIQHSGGSEGNLIEDKTILSLPNINHRNDDYMMGRGTRTVTISNIIKIKGKEGLTNIIDGYRGPEELRDNTLLVYLHNRTNSDFARQKSSKASLEITCLNYFFLFFKFDYVSCYDHLIFP